MNTQQLIDTAKALVAGSKGLLAMDEGVQCATNDLPKLAFQRELGPKALLHRARCDRAARRGEYSAAMEMAKVS